MPNTNERDALTYPEGFDEFCGLPAWAMQAANEIGASLTGDRKWDVPCIARALAAGAPMVEAPDGFKLAPLEPTPEMIAAGAECWHISKDNAEGYYRAMLAAAPAQQAGAPLPLAPSDAAGADLLPCPFCAGSAHITFDALGLATNAWAKCLSCGASVYAESGGRAGAVTEWNRRATPPQALPLAPTQDVTNDQIRSLWQTIDTGDIEDDIMSFARALLDSALPDALPASPQVVSWTDPQNCWNKKDAQ